MTGAAVALTLGACTALEPTRELTSTTSPANAPADTPDTDAADRDVCALLPGDELAEILGQEAQATAIPSAGWIAGQCTWSSGSAGFIMSVGTADSIEDFGDPAEPDAEAKLDAFRERASLEGAVVEIDDLGDGTVIGPTGMAVRAEGTYLQIEILSLTDEQLVEVARLAVSNIAG